VNFSLALDEKEGETDRGAAVGQFGEGRERERETDRQRED
jgi:hypothetical protein